LLTVIGLSSAAFGVAVAGALLPLISVELFVLGMAASGPELPWWLLALVIALGQLSGKLLYYYGARGAVRMPKPLADLGRALRDRGFLRPPRGSRSAGALTGGRWRRLLRRFRVLCRRHPWWAGLFLLFSAVLSLPPFAATSVVAGWARVSLSTFVLTAFVGRYLRFAGLAVAPALAVAAT